MSGTVNVARALWDDPTFKDAEMSQREAWIWMIAEASWKARAFRVGTHEVDLQRGQLAASTRFMAKAWMWSEPRVRRYLDMLENRRMIARATDAGVTVITICKYDDYQNAPSVGDAGATQQPTQERRTSDAKQNKEIKIDDDHDAGARASRLDRHPSPDPLPPDPTLRERILHACGADPVTGLTGPSGSVIGTRADMHAVARWRRDLGLDAETIIAVIADVMARKRDGPPARLTYFDRPMQAEAARRTEQPLKPAQHQQENGHGPDYEIYPPGPVSGDRPQHRSDAALEQIARLAGIGQAPGDGRI